MTTDDNAALIEEMSAAIYGAHPDIVRYAYADEEIPWGDLDEESQEMVRDRARAVLPIVLREKAGALREAADEDSETLYSVAGWEVRAVEAHELHVRADDYEKEATDGR